MITEVVLSTIRKQGEFLEDSKENLYCEVSTLLLIVNRIWPDYCLVSFYILTGLVIYHMFKSYLNQLTNEVLLTNKFITMTTTSSNSKGLILPKIKYDLHKKPLRKESDTAVHLVTSVAPP